MQDTRAFWMIHVIGSDPPRVRHYTLEAAQQEARRLALSMPGRSVVILEAVTMVVQRQFDVITLRKERGGDDIPF